MKILRKFKKLLKIIKPSINVGGMEISENGVLYVSIDEDSKKVSKYFVSLQPGTIKDGVVINMDVFLDALKKLRYKISTKENVKIPVIVSISDSNIYTRIFSIPYINNSGMDEAVSLNLEMVSPTDIEKTYYGWQYIGNGRHTGQQKVLSSFVDKKIVDLFMQALNNIGFFVVAIEQKAASLARVMNAYGLEDDKKSAVFVLSVDEEGISFSIIKTKYLYFNRFISWGELLKRNGNGKDIKLEQFQEIVIAESHRVMNYFTNQFGDGPSAIYLISNNFEEKLNSILAQEFKLPVRTLKLEDDNIDIGQFVAYGSALRGKISRTDDEQISLAPEGAKKRFLHMEIISFMKAWNVAISSVFSVVLITSLGVFIFMNGYMEKLNNELSKMPSNQNTKLLSDLKNEATEFNKNINRALYAKNQQNIWGNIVYNIYKNSGSVLINRFYVQSSSIPVSINAQAPKEQDALSFKQRLEEITSIEKIDLPLSAITQNSSGGVSFKLNFMKK